MNMVDKAGQPAVRYSRMNTEYRTSINKRLPAHETKQEFGRLMTTVNVAATYTSFSTESLPFPYSYSFS